MDTIKMIQNAILNFCDGVTITPWNNGGIQVNVDDAQNIAGVIATVADVMYDYGCNDVQITTNQAKYEVYIDEIEREEFEDTNDDSEED